MIFLLNHSPNNKSIEYSSHNRKQNAILSDYLLDKFVFCFRLCEGYLLSRHSGFFTGIYLVSIKTTTRLPHRPGHPLIRKIVNLIDTRRTDFKNLFAVESEAENVIADPDTLPDEMYCRSLMRDSDN